MRNTTAYGLVLPFFIYRKKELKEVFKKMLTALKPGGRIYTSFKYGEYEGERNGRYFTDFTIRTHLRILYRRYTICK